MRLILLAALSILFLGSANAKSSFKSSFTENIKDISNQATVLVFSDDQKRSADKQPQRSESDTLNSSQKYLKDTYARIMETVSLLIGKRYDLVNWNTLGNNMGKEVKIAFKIDNNGNLISLSILQSSGSIAADEFALEALRKTTPFPFPPEGISHNLIFRYDFSRKRKSSAVNQSFRNMSSINENENKTFNSSTLDNKTENLVSAEINNQRKACDISGNYLVSNSCDIFKIVSVGQCFLVNNFNFTYAKNKCLTWKNAKLLKKKIKDAHIYGSYYVQLRHKGNGKDIIINNQYSLNSSPAEWQGIYRKHNKESKINGSIITKKLPYPKCSNSIKITTENFFHDLTSNEIKTLNLDENAKLALIKKYYGDWVEEGLLEAGCKQLLEIDDVF